MMQDCVLSDAGPCASKMQEALCLNGCSVVCSMTQGRVLNDAGRSMVQGRVRQ